MDTNTKTTSPGELPGEGYSPGPSIATDAIVSDGPSEELTTAPEPGETPIDEEIEEENEQLELEKLNPVDRQVLATMVENGNWESVLLHLKAGNAVVLTSDMFESLVEKFDQFEAMVNISRRYSKLVGNLQHVVRALNPLLAHRNELAEYFDAESTTFVKTSKLLMEFGPSLMTMMLPGNKGKLDTPLTRLLGKVDSAHFEAVDMQSLLDAVQDSGVPTEDFMAFWEQIGAKEFFEKNKSQKAATDGGK